MDALLILHRIAQKGWVDARIIAPTLQRTVEEAAAALQRFSRVALEGSAVIRPVAGVQDSSASAYCLSEKARSRLTEMTKRWQEPSGRQETIREWVRHRGRVSTTEVADIAGVSVTYAGQILKELENDGLILPGRENRRGRGFFFTWVGGEESD